MAKQNEKLNARTRDFTRDVIKWKVSFSGRGVGKLPSADAARAAAKAEKAEEDRIEAKIVAITSAALKPITQAFGAVERLWKYGDGNGISGTKPWEDGGWRLGLACEYGAMRGKLDQLVREAKDAVRVHIEGKYDDIKAEAEKKLGGLIAGRFPSKSELIRRFDIQVFTDCLTSADDIRFSGLSESEAQAVVAQREAYYTTLITQSNQDMMADVIKAVSNLRERMEDEKSSFHGCEDVGYPIMEACEKMINRAEKFNLSGDQRLADMIAKARKALGEMDLTKAKEDPAARKEVAKKAATLQDELAEF